ncbi:unnamed protein product [Fraxinus pennsylvanica]|uniref:Bifunctional inhibitor/plant lipid transfer protein/seed storage helical domain-containing protein n=1 Tax=Fraxinus pennsylvanica TaxID=56036 RepID=A0AAD2E4Y4_9LAMI|nr:unnamed protein product [Fraxinus pennsylvanica]
MGYDTGFDCYSGYWGCLAGFDGARRLDLSRCKEEKSGLISNCRSAIYSRNPTATCRQMTRNVHFERVCPYVTSKVATIIEVQRALKLFQDCGRQVPHNFKCGSKLNIYEFEELISHQDQYCSTYIESTAEIESESKLQSTSRIREFWWPKPKNIKDEDLAATTRELRMRSVRRFVEDLAAVDDETKWMIESTIWHMYAPDLKIRLGDSCGS